MRGLYLVSAVAACAVIGACRATSTKASDADRSASIDRIARSVVQDRGVPGISLAVIRDGKPFKTLTYGSSNVETHTPATGATPFQLASTTKIFSSTAVLLLVAGGKLRLDDPIGDYLRDLPPSWRKVTVRQLLSHTSGLPDIARSTGELDLVANDWDAALRVVAGKPFQFAPRHGWAYTQTNYALLQRLIEKLSGEPFEDLRHGAKIDARNLTGFTALHHAAESGSLEAAKALLDDGANPDIRTKDGETASDVAQRKGNTAVARLIDSRTAKRRGSA